MLCRTILKKEKLNKTNKNVDLVLLLLSIIIQVDCIRQCFNDKVKEKNRFNAS